MTTSAPGSRPLGLMALLAGSLALNLFFIGLFGGAWFDRKDDSPRDRERAQSMQLMLEAVPKDRRDELKTLFASSRAERRDAREEARDVQNVVNAALAADPFDRSAVDRAQTAYFDARSAPYRRSAERLADFFETLDAAERAALVDAMEKARELRRKRREARRAQ